jgi:hypothetical protein
MTAEELLAYKGDPNLAYGSTALPAASTDAIVDTSPAIKAWSQYAQDKFQLAKEGLDDLKKKQLLAQVNLQKALDQGQYKIWDKDRSLFTQKYNDFAQLAVDVAKKGNWENINDPDYQKALQMQNDLQQFAQYSNQQMEHYNTGNNWYQEHQKDVLPTAQAQLDQYANVGDPIKRASMDYQFDPKIGFDLSKYFTPVLNVLKNDNPTLTAGQADRFGYVQYSHTGQLNIDGAVKMANSVYQSDPDAEDFGQHLIQTGQSTATTPKDAFVQNFVQATVPNSLAGEVKAVNWSPDSKAAATQVTVPYERFVPVTFKAGNSNSVNTGYLMDAYDIAKTAGAPANINLVPTEANDLATGRPISKDEIGTAVWKTDGMKIGMAFKNKAGGITLPTGTTPQEREASAQDLIKRGYPQEKVALVNATVPAFDVLGNQKGTVDKTYTIPYSDIAVQLENSKIRFEEQPTTTTTQTKTAQQPATIRVSLNGKIGEIPENQWESFKKKYPSATKQ